MEFCSYTPRVSLLVELTSQCNARCAFCYNPTRGEEQLNTSSTLELINKAIDEIGPYHVSFSGGEPLLRRDLSRLVRYVKDRGLKATVVTNGIALGKDRAKELFESGVDLFQVTLLAADQALHDGLAGGPFFERVVGSIAELVNAGAQVATSFVACKDNIANFEKTLELNALLRVRNVQFCRYNPGGPGLPGWRRLMPSPNAVEAALRRASSIASRYSMTVFVSVPVMPCLVDVDDLPGLSLGFCAVGNSHDTVLALDPLGNLKVCPHSTTPLGSAIDRSIPEILSGAVYSEFVDSLPPFCVDCPHVAACRGGCRSAAQLCFGTLQDEDPFLSVWKDRAVAARGDPGFPSRRILQHACAG